MAAKLKQLKDTFKAVTSEGDPAKALMKAILPLQLEGQLEITKATTMAKMAGLPKNINGKLRITELEVGGEKWFAILISISETPTKK